MVECWGGPLDGQVLAAPSDIGTVLAVTRNAETGRVCAAVCPAGSLPVCEDGAAVIGEYVVTATGRRRWLVWKAAKP